MFPYRYVLPRYVKLNRKKQSHASNSATATTLDDTKGTETQLLPEGAHADDKNSNCEAEPLTTLNGGTQSAYETTVFHFNRATMDSEEETALCDIETGVSSFLPHPPLRHCNGNHPNAESAYSSFEEDPADCGNYSEITDPNILYKDKHSGCNGVISNNGDFKKVYEIPDGENNTSCSPEYAVISRVARHRNDYQNVNDKNVFDNRHIQVVPEESSEATQSPSSATMHLIPEHKCLLHNIPPPPPPPTTRIADVEKQHSRNSWATVHAQV